MITLGVSADLTRFNMDRKACPFDGSGFSKCKQNPTRAIEQLNRIAQLYRRFLNRAKSWRCAANIYQNNQHPKPKQVHKPFHLSFLSFVNFLLLSRRYPLIPVPSLNPQPRFVGGSWPYQFWRRYLSILSIFEDIQLGWIHCVGIGVPLIGWREGKEHW